jgi:FkbM family methyltransferase
LDFLTGISGNLLHAGTFFGDFLPALARSRPGARVWAFEPNLENFRCAQMTIALNDLSNVTLMYGALDASPGEGRLRTTDGDGRSLGGKSHLAGDGEPVPLLTIDETLGAARVAAVQLDVEGNEQAALEGAMKMIRGQRPILVLETPPEEWIARELAPLGYREGPPVGPNRVFHA